MRWTVWMSAAVSSALLWGSASADEVKTLRLEIARPALAEEGLELRWTNNAPLAINRAGPIQEIWVLGPVVVGRTSDNQLVAFDADTGAFRWMRPAGRADRKSFPPTYSDRKIYATNYDTVFRIDVKTGALDSTLQLPFVPCTGLVREGDAAVIGGENQRFYFLDGDKGYRIWNRVLPGFLPYNPIMDDANERGQRGKIFFTDTTGRVFAYSPQRVQYWEFPAPGESVGKVAAQLGKVPSPYQLLLVPTDDNSLYALRQQSGVRVWQKRSNSSFNETPVAVVINNEKDKERIYADKGDPQDRVYVRNAEGILFALTADKGDDIWEFPGAGRFVCAGRNALQSVFLVNPDNTVSEVASYGAKIRTVAGERVVYTPKVRNRYQLGDLSLFATNAEDPVLFAATPDGRFCAIKMSEGEIKERRKEEMPYVPKVPVAVKKKDMAAP